VLPQRPARLRRHARRRARHPGGAAMSVKVVIAAGGREVTVESCAGTTVEEAVQEALATWRRPRPRRTDQAPQGGRR
jgi:hypothetical protein